MCTVFNLENFEGWHFHLTSDESKILPNISPFTECYSWHVRIQRGGGGQGVRTPPENHKNIGFPNNSGPDPLKITKLQSQHSMLGHHRPAGEWRFAGGPMMARLSYYLDPL